MRLLLAALIALGLTLACGCAGYGPRALQVGQTEAQVVATMGTPTGRYDLAAGATRLEFARGPAGKVTWMVDLDAAGKVTSFAQVLVGAYFEQVKRGMNRDELLRLLGRPSDVSRERDDRQTLSWRYDNIDCLWFQVTLTSAGYVMASRYLADSMCKGNL